MSPRLFRKVEHRGRPTRESVLVKTPKTIMFCRWFLCSYLDCFNFGNRDYQLWWTGSYISSFDILITFTWWTLKLNRGIRDDEVWSLPERRFVVKTISLQLCMYAETSYIIRVSANKWTLGWGIEPEETIGVALRIVWTCCLW